MPTLFASLAQVELRRGGRISLGVPAEGRDGRPSVLPTGFPELDACLFGGLPRGRLTEIWGLGSCGKLSLLLGALRSALAAGELVALVDLSRTAFLAEPWAEGLLVVHPRNVEEALRAADVLVSAALLSGVGLDLSGGVPQGAALPEPVQVRLARLAREGGTAVVACAERPILGSLASLRIEARPSPGGGFEAVVRKSRQGPPGGCVRLPRPAFPS